MRFIDALIPGWLKKLDRYLLLQYPQIWVTKLHYAVFFVLIINALLFLGTFLLFQFDLSDPLPRMETPFLLMILPAIVFYVWWFVQQSWYNVDKNYGKMSLGQDYLNFFIYWIIALLFYSTTVVISHTQNLKVSTSINLEELKSDIDLQRKLACYGYYYGDDIVYENDRFMVSRFPEIDWELTENSSYSHFIYHDEYTSVNDTYVSPEKKSLTESEVRDELEQLDALNKKYLDSHEYQKIDIDKWIYQLKTGQGINYYYTDIDYKMERLYFIKTNKVGFSLYDEIYLRIILAVTGILALLVWIFKNVHWKNYIAAAVSYIVSPFVIGIVAFIFFGILSVHGDEGEALALALIMGANLLCLLLILKPWVSQTFSAVGVVSAILLQTFQCFLPAIYYFMIDDIMDVDHWDPETGLYYDYYEKIEQLLYFSGMALTVLTLPLYKIYYKRMWALPKNK